VKKIEQAQRFLREMNSDGWLIYDFQGNNPLARLFLEIPPSQKTTRRLFYWIPAIGEPVKIVHAIESHVLDERPGVKRIFLSWESLQEQVGKVLKGKSRVAMEYSPNNAIPYVSKVDGGTIDFIRSFGVEVVSSGSFLPYFTARITPEQGESHIRAGRALDRIVNDAWDWIRTHLKQGRSITDCDVQQQIMREFVKEKLVAKEAPIVGVNEHSADPHYTPCQEKPVAIREGDFVLIDLWGKEDKPQSIYADITRVAAAATLPTEKQSRIFSIVRQAQRAATELVITRFKKNQEIRGFEVDDCARSVIRQAGFGDYFIHRTGHNIEVSLHGSGANMDNLEMHDERPILASTCFSIEPGIYLPNEFGVRLEYDLYVHQDGRVEIVGGEQNEIVCLM